MLQIKNLSKKYGQNIAVQGIDFQVQEGEILGLLGPNGAGKSTTISMIATLIAPDTGEIIYKEQNIAHNPNSIRKELGYVPQEIALYPTLTGMDNLKFWGQSYGLKGNQLKERIQEVAEIIGIKDRLKDRVEKYSGGMKRRLNIGSALLHHPKLIIFDEPTVGIDPQSRNHILDAIKKINLEGTTVIYTSHYMEEVEYLCTRTCIMDQGKIIASGTKESLVESIKGTEQVDMTIENINPGMIEVLQQHPYISHLTVQDNQLTFKREGQNGSYGEILDIIAHHGGKLQGMDVKKPDLETVFLTLTGKALRD